MYYYFSVKYPWVPGLNPTWSWCIIIAGFGLLLFCSGLLCWSPWVRLACTLPFLSCALSYLDQVDTVFIEWAGYAPFFSSYLDCFLCDASESRLQLHGHILWEGCQGCCLLAVMPLCNPPHWWGWTGALLLLNKCSERDGMPLLRWGDKSLWLPPWAPSLAHSLWGKPAAMLGAALRRDPGGRDLRGAPGPQPAGNGTHELVRKWILPHHLRGLGGGSSPRWDFGWDVAQPDSRTITLLRELEPEVPAKPHLDP